MNWKTMLAYVTGSVDDELLRRNEYLVAENRILRAQIKGRFESDRWRTPDLGPHWQAARAQSARRGGQHRAARDDPGEAPPAGGQEVRWLGEAELS